MSDLISRQDAIDEIQMLLEQFEDDEHDKTWNNAIRGAVNAVKHHTKSAQPEIIVDNALTEEEIKNIKQKMADSPLVFIQSAQPTIDAVEVVRCKDCKYWNEFIMNRKPQGYGLCTLHEITHKTDTDWFCADGERRDPCSSQDS